MVKGDRHRISIIVLTWNKKEVLERCLRSIEQTVIPSEGLEFIVVDNGSSDGTALMVKERFPRFRVVRIEKNDGVTKGLNLALSSSSPDSEFIVLLNNDLEFRGVWLERLLEPALEDPEVGITGCKLKYPSGKIQHAGGRLDKERRTIHIGYHDPDNGQFDGISEMELVTGAVMLIRRRVVEEIGCFDEGFTPYLFEDVDYCLRARRAGFRIMYTGKTDITHHERSTIQMDASSQVMRISYRNHLRLILRNIRARSLALLLPRLMGRDLVFELRRGKTASLLGAWYDVLKGLPSMMAYRKKSGSNWPLLG